MKEAPTTTLILFGVSGDLSKRKIVPSLIHLYEKNLLPVQFRILGVTRQDISIDDVFKSLENDFTIEVLNGFKKLCEIFKIDVENISDFKMLRRKLAEIDKNNGERIFYLSVPPETLPLLIKSIGTTQSNDVARKLIFEKPFGTNYDSARELIKETRKYFTDEEVYHIDHYIAKPMVQNIPKWKESYEELNGFLNKDNVKKIEILSLESLGVEDRVKFYDNTGALRDLIQSHLLEVLAIVIKNKDETRVEVLNKLFSKNYIKRAQYKGYSEETKNVASKTETFAEVTFYSNDENWKGVPFTLVTGKALEKKVFQINLELDDTIIKLEQEINTTDSNLIMDHEKLLYDAFHGDKALFLGNDEILATWKLIDPIIEKWSFGSDDLFIYDKGSTLEDIRWKY